MSTTTEKTTAETTKKSPHPSTVTDPALKRSLRRNLKRTANKKRDLKLRTDKEFAKAFFEARSKRSTEKKSIFRKKKSRKK